LIHVQDILRVEGVNACVIEEEGARVGGCHGWLMGRLSGINIPSLAFLEDCLFWMKWQLTGCKA
jgi:hypothetical protein